MWKSFSKGEYSLKSKRSKPLLYIRKGAELSLSGPALVELIRAVLDKGMSFRFRAKGFSMSPFIKDGDVVAVSPLHGILPSVGNIIAVIHPGTGRLVVHRLVGKRGYSFLIKGDNNPDTDRPVFKTDILGCVKSVEREGKKVFIGLGPERFLIAFLTRMKLFILVLSVLRFVRNILFPKKKKQLTNNN